MAELNFLEKNLEDIIYETDPILLNERGLECYQYHAKLRQFHMGVYGKADLITFFVTTTQPRTQIEVTIYEFKQDKIDHNTLLQAMGYAKGVMHLLQGFDLSNHQFSYKIVLVGKTIDLKTNFCYSPDVFANVNLYTYEYKFDGIHFTWEDGYKRSDYEPPITAINSLKTAAKDLSRFIVDAKKFNY